MTAGLRAEKLEGIEYSRVAGAPLLLDAFIPDGTGPFPAVVIVHGGAWVTGDRAHTVAPLFAPLEKAHIAWFSIDYRLARVDQATDFASGASALASMGLAVTDVRRAVLWVKAHAAEYRVDPSRMALIGESAGAQLAAMAALKPDPGGDVRAVVSFYGPSNLGELVRSSPMFPRDVRRSLEGTPFANLAMAALGMVSPVNFVHRGAPPFLLIHGTADALVPFAQSKEFEAKLLAAGVPAELYAVRGAGHGIRWWESERLTGYKHKMVDWLEQELSRVDSERA